MSVGIGIVAASSIALLMFGLIMFTVVTEIYRVNIAAKNIKAGDIYKYVIKSRDPFKEDGAYICIIVDVKGDYCKFKTGPGSYKSMLKTKFITYGWKPVKEVCNDK